MPQIRADVPSDIMAKTHAYTNLMTIGKPDRKKDFSRIDLLAATIDALDGALVFEDRGISYTELRSVG